MKYIEILDKKAVSLSNHHHLSSGSVTGHTMRNFDLTKVITFSRLPILPCEKAIRALTLTFSNLTRDVKIQHQGLFSLHWRDWLKHKLYPEWWS